MAPGPCRHCGTRVPEGAPFGEFCCAGCEAVFGLLRDGSLDRFYDLAGGKGLPVAEPPRARSYAWLEPLLAKVADGPLCALELDVQGVHCAGCVWLMNELFRRRAGGVALTVNSGLGKVRAVWRKGAFDLAGYLAEVERFGYLFGPSRKGSDLADTDLLVRLSISAALSLFVMLFAEGFYFGLSAEHGPLFELFGRLGLVLAGVVVWVGGWPFFKGAVAGLRRGLLHLDVPIAAGVLLAFGLSVAQVLSGRGDHGYLDALTEFVTLMLFGRWLQRRVVAHNRRLLLDGDGAEGIAVRRLSGDRLEWAPATSVREGDLLLSAPGDAVPVDCELLEDGATVSCEWMTGEAEPRAVQHGELVRAGSFNLSSSAIRLRARTDYDQSPLGELLRSGGPRAEPAPRWGGLSRGYVAAVIGLSALGFLLWLPHGLARAIDVSVAVLVVTCPCAVGLAVPLAYELVQARLRRRGFFVRSSTLLDRLPRVRKVAFDKTGTLTLRRLSLREPALLAALPAEAAHAAYNLAARSNHPVSRVLGQALERRGERFEPSLVTTEVPGAGVELSRDQVVWRLGAPAWAGASGATGTVLTRDGRLVAAFQVDETARPDARSELSALAAAGYELWVLSGDASARVEALAERLGLPPSRALGDQRPKDKATALAARGGGDTLYFGDGLNDSLAFEEALCAGTPAVDQPVLPSKADFFMLGESLAPLRAALVLSRRLSATVRAVLGLGLAYNVAAVAAALAGVVTPLWAAVAMPLSSVLLLLFTVAWLAGERRPRPLLAARREVPAWTP